MEAEEPMSNMVPRRQDKPVDDFDIIWDNADAAKARLEDKLRGNPYERIVPQQVSATKQAAQDAVRNMPASADETPEALGASAMHDIAKIEASNEVMKQLDEGVMQPHRGQAFYRGIWDRY